MSGLEPFMAAAALGSSVVGAAGQYASGVTAQRQAYYQARVLDAQGEQARLDAGSKVQAELDRSARELGSGVVAGAAQGGGLGGSVLNVLNDMGVQSMQRARTAANEGIVAGTQLNANADSTRQQGDIARWKGTIGAVSTLLGSAMQLSGEKSMARTAATIARGRAPAFAGGGGVGS